MADSSPQPIEISETSSPDEPDTGPGCSVKKISSVPSLLQSAITPSPRSGSAKVFLPPTQRADFFLCESVPSDPHFASLAQMYNFKSHPSSEKPTNSLSPRTPLTEPMWFGSASARVQVPTVDASCSMHSSFPQNERKRCLPQSTASCPPDETPVSLPRTPQATRSRQRSSYGITPKPSARIHSTTPTPVAYPQTPNSGAASASTIQLKKQTKPTSTQSPAKSAVAQSPRTMPLRMRRRVVAPSISSGCSSLCAPGGARIPLSNSISDSDATIFAPLSKEKPERHTERPFENTASGSGDIGVPLRSAHAVTAECEAPGAQETTPAPTLLATPFAQRSKCTSAAPGGVVRAVRPVDAITDALWWTQGRDTPCTAILKEAKDEEEETDVETEDEFDEADPMEVPTEQCVETIPEAEINYLVDVGDTESAMWQEKMQRVEKIGKLELRLERRWRAESRRSCLRREEKAAIKAFRDLCTTLDDSSQDFIEVPPDDNSDPFIRRYTAPQWEASKPLAF